MGILSALDNLHISESELGELLRKEQGITYKAVKYKSGLDSQYAFFVVPTNNLVFITDANVTNSLRAARAQYIISTQCASACKIEYTSPEGPAGSGATYPSDALYYSSRPLILAPGESIAFADSGKVGGDLVQWNLKYYEVLL